MIDDTMVADYKAQFEKNGFVKIKNVLSPEIIEMYKSFIDISHLKNMRNVETGEYIDVDIQNVDHNVLDDSILLYCQHIIEKIWGIDGMVPSYAFSREYFQGSELKLHRDREACQYSITITMCKRGEGTSFLWFSENDDKSNAIPVDLDEGDAIIFNGGSNYGGKWHWRDPLELDSLVQLFLHYVHPEMTHLADNDYPRPFYRSR
jgi:hypothetical protein